MMNIESLIVDWKYNLYILSLALFMIGLPISNAIISLSTVFLLVVWVVTGDFKSKFKRLEYNKVPLLLMSVFVIYLIGFMFAKDQSLAIKELSKGLPWLIFGLVLGSSPQMSRKSTDMLILLYCLSVVISAIIAFVRLMMADSIGLINFRVATLVDHMPFSFQLAFVIWIIIYYAIRNHNLQNTSQVIINYGRSKISIEIVIITFIMFLITILLVIKSFNAYIYFGVMSFIGIILIAINTKHVMYRRLLIGLSSIIVLVPVIYLTFSVIDYYDVKEYNIESIDKTTSKGNIYYHDFSNKSKENGNYTWLFICEDELIPLWNKNSNVEYNSYFKSGEPYRDIIVRYMTSKGLRKDADGYMKLTKQDIHNIEEGMANCIYSNYTFSIYPRVYETIWEIDQYIITRDPNLKSLAQRIDLTILGIDIIKKHFWTGIGLGNYMYEYEVALNNSDSKLEKCYLGSPHNQYLSYMIRFGIFGTIYIISVLIYAFVKYRKQHSFLFTIFFVSMLFANFGDANFETFIGSNFFFFFFCLFLWTIPRRALTENES